MQYLERRQIAEVLTNLIRIPSVNPHLGQKIQNEMDVARFIKDWLLKREITASIEMAGHDRPNVYAEIGEGSGPVLCLCGHLDTVGTEEMTIPPFEPAIEGNKVFGRGSCDMKGGVAAILCAAAAFKEAKIKGKLILALVCDEEYASIGAEDFVKRHKADACILTEPSDLKMLIAHKGFLWGKVTTRGKSAHGSRWDLGESAISKMGAVLTALDNFDKTILRNRIDPLVGPASMHVGMISGGTGVSTYASSCTIDFERRTLPEEKMENVKAELVSEICKAVPSADIHWEFYRLPFSCSPDEEIAKSVRLASKMVLGNAADSVGWGFWTDAALFQEAGIPTVNIGPIGFGLHEPVEWVDLESVQQTASILFQAAKIFTEKTNP